MDGATRPQSISQSTTADTLRESHSFDFFLLQSQSKVSEVKKAAEKTTQSKSSTGIGRLFGNVAKKQQSAADDKKAAPSRDRSGSSEVTENRSRSPGSSENVAASTSKSAASKKSTRPASSSPKAVNNSPKKAVDASRTADKQYVQFADYFLFHFVFVTLFLVLIPVVACRVP